MFHRDITSNPTAGFWPWVIHLLTIPVSPLSLSSVFWDSHFSHDLFVSTAAGLKSTWTHLPPSDRSCSALWSEAVSDFRPSNHFKRLQAAQLQKFCAHTDIAKEGHGCRWLASIEPLGWHGGDQAGPVYFKMVLNLHHSVKNNCPRQAVGMPMNWCLQKLPCA